MKRSLTASCAHEVHEECPGVYKRRFSDEHLYLCQCECHHRLLQQIRRVDQKYGPFKEFDEFRGAVGGGTIFEHRPDNDASDDGNEKDGS